MTQESIRRPVQQNSLNSNKRKTILHQMDENSKKNVDELTLF